MMVLWEEQESLVKDMGAKLFLDSGTLTPVLNALEKGYVIRRRSSTDKCDMYAVIIEKGMALREKAVEIPAKLGACLPLEPEDAITLYQILHKMMEKL